MDQIAQNNVDEMLMATLHRHVDGIDSSEPLLLNARLTDLGLDSLAAVNLLLDVEETFAISFPDSMLNEETFRTGATLLMAVRTLLDSSIHRSNSS